MQTGEIADHPFAIMRFPVKRPPPVFTIYNFPAFKKPPAEILVSIVANELQVIAVGHKCSIECVVLQEHLVRRLLVIESETVVDRTLDIGHSTLDLGIAQPEQSTLDLRHAFNFHSRFGRNTYGRIKLVAQEMFDVINQQFLVLHLVLESESHKASKLVRLVID